MCGKVIDPDVELALLNVEEAFKKRARDAMEDSQSGRKEIGNKKLKANNVTEGSVAALTTKLVNYNNNETENTK